MTDIASLAEPQPAAAASATPTPRLKTPPMSPAPSGPTTLSASSTPQSEGLTRDEGQMMLLKVRIVEKGGGQLLFSSIPTHTLPYPNLCNVHYIRGQTLVPTLVPWSFHGRSCTRKSRRPTPSLRRRSLSLRRGRHGPSCGSAAAAKRCT